MSVKIYVPDYLGSVLADAFRFAVRRRAEWGTPPDEEYREVFEAAEWRELQEVAAASTRAPMPRTLSFPLPTGGRTTFPVILSDADKKAVWRDAGRGELGRWPLGLLALNFNEGEVYELVIEADNAQQANRAKQQDRRRVARLRGELQDAMDRIEGEDEAKRVADIERRARAKLGWPKTGFPPDDQ